MASVASVRRAWGIDQFINGVDGVEALRLVYAVYDSARQGKVRMLKLEACREPA